jgi:hypothetical protein
LIATGWLAPATSRRPAYRGHAAAADLAVDDVARDHRHRRLVGDLAQRCRCERSSWVSTSTGDAQQLAQDLGEFGLGAVELDSLRLALGQRQLQQVSSCSNRVLPVVATGHRVLPARRKAYPACHPCITQEHAANDIGASPVGMHPVLRTPAQARPSAARRNGVSP